MCVANSIKLKIFSVIPTTKLKKIMWSTIVSNSCKIYVHFMCHFLASTSKLSNDFCRESFTF